MFKISRQALLVLLVVIGMVLYCRVRSEGFSCKQPVEKFTCRKPVERFSCHSVQKMNEKFNAKGIRN